MRLTDSKSLCWLAAVAMAITVGSASHGYGQATNLFAAPLSGGSATVTPVVSTVNGQALQSTVFEPPGFAGDSMRGTAISATADTSVPQVYVVGPNATIRPQSQAVEKSVPSAATQVLINGALSTIQSSSKQNANQLWAPPPVVAQASKVTPVPGPAAKPIDAYVVTKSGVEPVGLNAPACSGSAIAGVDLSNLNMDGSCGAEPCGCGMCAEVPSCGASCGGSCGGGGCGCGSRCRNPMQCTSACCGNKKCSSLCGCSCDRCPLWARVDALLFYMDGYATPALITRSPGGTAQNVAGVLGNNSTRTLFGNNDVGDKLRVGARVQMGYWFDPCRKFGIQGDFFSLGGAGESTVVNGNGTDAFARPFFNTNPNVNAEDSQIFAMPGLAEGSVRINTSSSVVSAGPALRWNLCCCQDPCSSDSRRVDFLLGYRFFGVEEEFASQEILRPTDGLFVDGTRYELNDRITTENEFHGVEFGLNHMRQRGQWMWDVATLFAVGEVKRSVQLDGSTRITVPGFQDNTLPGGFYVGANDVGRYEDRDYAVIPQVRANLSYCLGCDWRLGVGYNFMYLNSMFRPDSYLNTTFDGSRLARVPTIGVVGDPPATPKRDLFLHGVNVNLTYNF